MIMKIREKRIIKYMLLCAFALLMLFAMSSAVFADEATTGAEIPKDAESYTLTYPDGTVITENEQGEPLTYDDVARLMNDENWKLMASGLVSDENGEVPLPATWEKGTIKIIETKVPEGYTQGEVSEIIAELEDGIATFVNPKVKDPDPVTPVDPAPTDPSEPSKPSVDPTPTKPDTPSPTPTKTTPDTPTPTPTKTTNPPAAKTGDTSDIVLWTGVLGLAMASACTLISRRSRKEGTSKVAWYNR